MHSRISSSARLATRVSAAGLKAVRPSAALFSHSPVASTSASTSRLISTTRFVAEEPKSTLETLSTSHPTDAEAEVKADSAPSPLADADLASSKPTPAEPEAPAVSSEDTYAANKAEENTRTVFVGGLSWNVDNEWLQDELLKALEVESGVESVRIARNPMGKSKGFAFVVFDNIALAKSADGLTLEIDSRSVEIRAAGEAPARAPRAPRSDRPITPSTSPRNAPSGTVWLGNIPWGTTPAYIEDLFSPFGEIRRVSLPVDSETGRGRGIAYVEFDAPTGASEVVKEAFEGKGFEIDGRAVRVDFAEEKSSRDNDRRPSFGGSRGRGGGRGGFGGRGGGRGGGGQRRDGGRDGGERRERREWRD
ncbi:hypothetical protein P7C70_g8128, partial [Phenoliferia sp. Uapishka_3]